MLDQVGGTSLLESVREPHHTVGTTCANSGGHEKEQEVAELKPQFHSLMSCQGREYPRKVVWRPAASLSPGNLSEILMLDPTLTLLNQKLWGGRNPPYLCFIESSWGFCAG